MRCSALSLLVLLAAPRCFAAVVDGASADQWRPCLGWVSQAPATYGVTNEGGKLVFQATGAGTELPWALNLNGRGFTGEERYLLVRYQATGVVTPAGNYFLHGEEGTHGGRGYIMADDLQPDGQWHTVAVDLVAVQPQEPTRELALKVIVGLTGSARLTIEKIWMTEVLPADAKVARVLPRLADARTVVEWGKTQYLRPQTGWTTTPASAFSHEATTEGLRLRINESGRGMRWLAKLATPVDLARTPHLSLRYKATGSLGRETYVFWLGTAESGSGGQATIALTPGDLKADGQWHTLQTKVNANFTVPLIAIGLDSLGAQAEMILSDLTFSSAPRRWQVADVLPDLQAATPWPAGQDGLTVLPLRVTGGQGTSFLKQRLEVEDWFTTPDLKVGGLPFHVPTEPREVPVTLTGESGQLRLAVPPGCRELFLLTAAGAPPTEPWGLDSQRPRPQDLLDVPEKVCYEIHYTQGPPDQVLPLDVSSGQWGMKRGLSLNAVHPDPRRRAVALVLREAMQTACFGLVAATANSGPPRVPEPSWQHLSYPTPPPGALAKARPEQAPLNLPLVTAGALRCRLEPTGGLQWADLGLSGLPGKLSCGNGPVFEVRTGGKLLPAEEWVAEPWSANGPAGEGARRFGLRHPPTGLRAQVEVGPGKGHQLLLRMSLTNQGAEPVKATLHFPVLREVKLGTAADTWYLYGKRGGVIHPAEGRYRDPLGERHPLQMDGFFNPRTGLALACLTHDTVAQHHFINLGKTAQGGDWSIEYPDRVLAPQQSFEATEAALVVREGDWRAIFGAYRQWLASWFKPAAPRQKWFNESFAICATNVHYDAYREPQRRGALQPLVDNYRQYLGVCDRIHLFGWGASQTYGDWGDYNHYDEVGGLEYFRENIRRVQEKGIAVSLYLDGYLSCEKGQLAGSRAQEWAMRRPDGSPQYIKEYDAYNQCPYLEGWQEHLATTYARVSRETGAKVLYLDEFGTTDGRWICHAADHGHNAPEIPYAGEVATMKRIREAVGPRVPIYTEYAPAEVSRRYLDGSISYQALWSADMEPLVPHFIDLPRFAFPDFKQFHIIHYAPLRAGNWWLHKFPFFNAEVFRIGEPNLAGMDAAAVAFLRRAVQIQCAHRATFAGPDVEPLVPTLHPGLFANRFSGGKETAWTLYNANGRGLRGPLLRIKHVPGATYRDAWNGRPLQPVVRGDVAEISLELGPKAVGCVIQKRP